MADFEDAEFVAGNESAGGANPELEITTDDLVFMLGEKMINERQKDKILRFKDRQYQELYRQAQQMQSQMQQVMAEAQSKSLAVDESRASNESLRTRIAQLEKQVHEVALERDDWKEKYAAMLAERNEIAMSVKSKKQPKKQVEESHDAEIGPEE